jgi:hypothetical protein
MGSRGEDSPFPAKGEVAALRVFVLIVDKPDEMEFTGDILPIIDVLGIPNPNPSLATPTPELEGEGEGLDR